MSSGLQTLGDSFVGEAVGTGFSGQIASMRLCRKTVRPRLVKRCAKTLGDGTCIASLSGSDTKNPLLLARVFQDKFHFINTIVPKNCAPKTCQNFQTLAHGRCIASLAGSGTKRAELLARMFQDKFHQRDCPEKLVPKTSQTVGV